MSGLQQTLFHWADDVEVHAKKLAVYPDLACVDVPKLILAAMMLRAAGVILGDFKMPPER